MPVSAIEELLTIHGVKPTPQRVVIAQYLLECCSHPTAEEVFDAVAKRLPVALSRATVYNTLNALVAAGVIKEVFTDPGRTRYDANLAKHHHLVDVKTGEILDIPWEEVPLLSVAARGKYRIHGYQITFFGEIDKDK